MTDVTLSTSGSRPALSRSNSNASGGGGYEADSQDNFAGALTLIDVFETFFDSRIDLLERRLKGQSIRLKAAAEQFIPKGLRTPRGTPITIEGDEDHNDEEQVTRRAKYKRDAEKEVERLRLKLATKVNDLSKQWHSAQIVRTRDKISFLFGVLTLTFTCLAVGHAPEYIPAMYSIQSCFYLPSRAWSYKRKGYHYFLFDLCYFVNIMDLAYLWFFRSNVYFFITCWCLTLGPIASAIITWRNSLVFHSLDKVTSLFIHMYPPLTLVIIKHFAKDRELNYPAVAKTAGVSWFWCIIWSAIPYILWQAAYWAFVIVARREKIESGQRQTSFRYMLNDKHGPIGKALQKISPAYREASFMGGQLVYSIICMLPAATFLIKSPTSCIVFLFVIFGVSIWNGASYYVEVFGRKFEKELDKLRREMEASPHIQPSSTTPSTAQSPNSSPRTSANTHLNAFGGLEPATDLSKNPLSLGASIVGGEEGKKEQ